MGAMPLFLMYSVICWGTSASTAPASISGGAWMEGGHTLSLWAVTIPLHDVVSHMSKLSEGYKLHNVPLRYF